MSRGTTTDQKWMLNAALEGLLIQQQRIDAQLTQIRAMLGIRRRGRPPKSAAALPSAIPAKAVSKRRPLSAAARKRIAMAQKKRWAEYRKNRAAAGAQ